ncbi:hypothetical protein ENUP19_0340G0004 [Entamoeba nuttalli]|uniref:Uncharacterized protein n=1 Tax=Entamoeba nuttalli TaxID=412467 RepID=A0ABQ0DX42_9EUKA
MFFHADTLNNIKARKICKILFICGFFFMPVMWMVLIWFLFKYVSPLASYRNRYIILAAVLIIIEFSLLLLWNIIFQYKWSTWGAVGDILSVNKYQGQL